MQTLKECQTWLQKFPEIRKLEIHYGEHPPRVRLFYPKATPLEEIARVVRKVKDDLLHLYPHLMAHGSIEKALHSLTCRSIHDPEAQVLTLLAGGPENDQDLQTLEWRVLEAEALLEEAQQKREKLWMSLATLGALVFGALGKVLEIQGHGASLFAYLLAFLSGGAFATIRAVQALKEKKIDVDLLMVLAALGAFYLGHPFEGVVLLFLFSLSSTLELLAMDKSRRAIRRLLSYKPQEALLLYEDREIQVPSELLRPGDRVRLIPGTQVPTDGKILEGTGHFDTSHITGESIPILKRPGHAVYAGSLLLDGTVVYEVTRPMEESTLSKTIQMIKTAREHKGKTQRLADAFGQVYTLFVLVGSVLLYFLFRSWFGLGHDVAFYRAMVFLVVASPCAVVLATPAAILSAIAHGARKGILFKGGAYVEQLGRVDTVAFDKTGTLTRGDIQIHGVVTLNGATSEEVLQWAASLERYSEHPFARAIVAHARSQKLPLLPVEGFEYKVGLGVSGKVQGHEIFVGRPPKEFLNGGETQHLLANGFTVVGVYKDGIPIGIITLSDVLREEAHEVVQTLHKIGIRRIVMLTGDRREVAKRIAETLGMDEYYAGLRPEEKVETLRKLQAQGRRLAMVGDGVNDGPVLATAEVGMAIGGVSTDVALETADVVLMRKELRNLPYAIQLARKARTIVLQNLAFALTVILVMVVLNFLGKVPLTLGVLGHEGSTVLVILNSLRLLLPLSKVR